MNCKPGDLAIIILRDPLGRNFGAMVEVIAQHKEGLQKYKCFGNIPITVGCRQDLGLAAPI